MHRLPGARLQAKGLLATEAFVSIPFAGAHPLAVRSHFFEFLDDQGTICLADELLVGRRYSIVVTTGGGLWRYRLGDRVEVDQLVRRTPSVRFVGRDDRVVDHFGEKLSDGFVARAISETLAYAKVHARFSMLAPESIDDEFRYTLFLQSPQPVPRDLSARLDNALRANPHYDY